MTTASGVLASHVEPVSHPRRGRLRFIAAFTAGLLVTLGVGAAGVLAYDVAHEGRVLRGIRVGSVDLSGMDRSEASAALHNVYDAMGDGQVVVHTTAGDLRVGFDEFGRRPDVGAMVAEAMATGRSGSPIERARATVGLAVEGAVLAPRLTFDEGALAAHIVNGLDELSTDPVDATITMTPAGIAWTPARPGHTFDAGPVQAAAVDAVRRLDAPALVELEAPAITLRPARTTSDVLAAKQAAQRMIGPVVVTHGKQSWTIPAETVAGWVSLRTEDGTIRPVVDLAAIPAALGGIEKEVRRKPVSATFLTGKSGAIVGVKEGRDGRRLDTAATAAAVAAELAGRAGGVVPGAATAVISVLEPEVTTAEAEQLAPRMERLGAWKTWFPIGERNAWGANIWLPARFINGTVLAPGQRFEWWRAIGPVTRERGFGMGGVIKGDHTEPTGAIGGGMCSSSTTLFNAALRAGLKMGARSNHRYYITRYPLGLDATVSDSQTMTFTNDMPTPILIRGFKVVGRGGVGWVRYEIWGVDDGRTVHIGKARVSNLRRATTKTITVSTLEPGERRQTEYAANGMDVSVTRVVRDRDGAVIHRDVYRSHYTRWTGIILVGG